MRLTLSLVAAVTLGLGWSRPADSILPRLMSFPPTPKYAFGEPGISPDGREIAFTSGGDIWTVPVSRRRGASPRGRSGLRSTAVVLTRRTRARVRLIAHRRRRHLRHHARDRHASPADLGRRAGAARRMVARFAVDLLQLDGPRRRRDERHLPRRARGRHAGSRSPPIATSMSLARPRLPMATGSPSAREASDPTSGGARPAVTSINRSCGSSTSTRSRAMARAPTPRSRSATRASSRRCGTRTDRRCSTSPIATASRTSGRDRRQRRAPIARSRASATGACCGPRSRQTARRSRSSATSASGPWTPRAGRRTKCRSRGEASRRRPRPSARG